MRYLQKPRIRRPQSIASVASSQCALQASSLAMAVSWALTLQRAGALREAASVLEEALTAVRSPALALKAQWDALGSD